MNSALRRLVVLSLAMIVLCGLGSLLGTATPGQAGGPEATPTCDCSGGGSATPVPNTSSIVGYAYDFSTGPAVPRKDINVTLTGCSWSAIWGTDDNGYFYFHNLGAGKAHVAVQLPPGGHAVNPNVIVETSGLTQTYTVYLGYYTGDPPLGELKTPDGKSLTGINEVFVTLPPETTPDGSTLPDVGGTFPDSYLVIGMSALLLISLPFAGLAQVGRFGKHRLATDPHSMPRR